MRQDRKQLVGLTTEDGSTVIPEGAQLVVDPTAPIPVPMCGHVTSSYYSACLNKPIAMALVAGGHSKKGEIIYASLADGSAVPMKITSPVFYDAKGERQNV
jgi:sarcosine oxidase subunit alpha